MSSSWGAVHRWVKPLPSIAFRPSGRFLPTIQSTSPFVISGAASYSKWAFKSVADADQVVVAADGNYGSKQVISVTPRLYDYLLANVREPQVNIQFYLRSIIMCFQYDRYFGLHYESLLKSTF